MAIAFVVVLLNHWTMQFLVLNKAHPIIIPMVYASTPFITESRTFEAVIGRTTLHLYWPRASDISVLLLIFTLLKSESSTTVILFSIGHMPRIPLLTTC